MTSIAFSLNFKCENTILIPNNVECVIFCQCLIGAVSLVFEGSQKNCYFLQN